MSNLILVRFQVTNFGFPYLADARPMCQDVRNIQILPFPLTLFNHIMSSSPQPIHWKITCLNFVFAVKCFSS